jgi:hypothetical protein
MIADSVLDFVESSVPLDTKNGKSCK